MRPVIAEFIGPAASGKSVTLQATAQLLAQARLKVAMGPVARPVRPLKAMARPDLALTAWRLGRHMERLGTLHDFGYWINRLHQVDRLYRRGADIILSDEGTFQALRRFAPQLPVSLFRAVPRPDIVVHVSAPSELIYRRRMKRLHDNPDIDNGISGRHRWQKSVRRAATVLRAGEGEAGMAFLRDWGQRLAPPLSEAEMEAALTEARAILATDSYDEDIAAFRRLVEGRGCRWMEVVSAQLRDEADAAQAVAELCRQHLDMRRAAGKSGDIRSHD